MAVGRPASAGKSRQWTKAAVIALIVVAVARSSEAQDEATPEGETIQQQAKLGPERIVFQTTLGDIEFGLYHEVAPRTCTHVVRLVQAGLYDTNHFWRVEPGFVAQVAQSLYQRTAKLSPEQRTLAEKTVPLEVVPHVKHLTGTMSMARGDALDSGGDSLVFMLGPAEGNDMQYTAFGHVTGGMEVLRRMEQQELQKEEGSIFTTPKTRITILSSFVFYVGLPSQQPSFRDPTCQPCWTHVVELDGALQNYLHMIQEGDLSEDDSLPP